MFKLLPICCVFLVACERTPDTTADVQAINQVREREIAAFSSGQIDSLLALFDKEFIVLPPNEPAVVGEAGMRSWMQNIFQQVTISGRYTSSDVVLSGEWAIERYTGVLTTTPKSGGKAVEEVVKGLHIYRRQADGGWRIRQDVWNTDAPPPATGE